jgi:hypothetical protein
VHEINVDGPKDDALIVHFLAATILGIAAMKEHRFKSAELGFDDALMDVGKIARDPGNGTGLSGASIASLRQLKAASIVEQITTGATQTGRADEALRAMTEVMNDPASGIVLKAAGGIDTGILLRYRSQFESDPTQRDNNLYAAVGAYKRVTDDAELAKRDPFIIAIAWNGLGVVFEKLAGPGPRLDLEPLRSAEHAYANAVEWLHKSSEGSSAAPECDRDASFARLLTSIENNLGVSLDKQGAASQSPRVLKRAIKVLSRARKRIATAPEAQVVEPTLLNNLASSYRHLADHEDNVSNLKIARSLLLEGLALPILNEDRTGRGVLIDQLARVDASSGRHSDNMDTRRAVKEWACAFDIFEQAGWREQVRDVVYSLQQVSIAICSQFFGRQRVAAAELPLGYS